MNIDERYHRVNKHRVNCLIPEYSEFIEEYVAAMATIGKYAGIKGETLEEKAMIIEVIKTKQLIETKDILAETKDRLDSVLNYADERNGILVAIKDNILEDDSIRAVAETLYDTNSRIDDLRQTVDNLFSGNRYTSSHELTYDLKDEE